MIGTDHGAVERDVLLDDLRTQDGGRDGHIDTERVIKALDVSEEEFAQATRYGKLPVGFILDHLNYRGKKRGGVQISEKHCAYFINTGDAHAEEVIILISEIKMKVRNELGIQLQEEVQYLGF